MFSFQKKICYDQKFELLCVKFLLLRLRFFVLEINMEGLREQVMINQFIMVAGCAREQAQQILQSSQWQFEVFLYYTMQNIDWCFLSSRLFLTPLSCF